MLAARPTNRKTRKGTSLQEEADMTEARTETETTSGAERVESRDSGSNELNRREKAIHRSCIRWLREMADLDQRKGKKHTVRLTPRDIGGHHVVEFNFRRCFPGGELSDQAGYRIYDCHRVVGNNFVEVAWGIVRGSSSWPSRTINEIYSRLDAIYEWIETYYSSKDQVETNKLLEEIGREASS